MKKSNTFTLLAIGLASAIVISAEERPNVLWITAEDMSPTLGCYGDKDAITPHLDAFAKQSVRYTKAYASAPVCSPSRSCLITGCYPPSLSTQQMRSGFPMPERMKGFPALLRKARLLYHQQRQDGLQQRKLSGYYKVLVEREQRHRPLAQASRQVGLHILCLQPDDFPPKPHHGLATRKISQGSPKQAEALRNP